MAKDNVPFHTVGFPSTILGSREPWKLVDYLKAFNWLTYYGGKFSTSQGVGVFMDQALELLPADYWRYYLMANAPESDDTSFTWETFAVAIDKDLADTLGNFVNRTLKFTEARFGSAVPSGGAPGPEEAELVADLDARVANYTELLSRLEFRKAMAQLRDIWRRGNEYFDAKAPWAAVKTDPDAAAVTLRYSINLALLFARLASPVIPSTATTIMDALHVPEAARGWPRGAELDVLPAGAEISVPDVLFTKVSDRIDEWRERFGGPSEAEDLGSAEPIEVDS
jgi:methionyl-tRNA synthetase